jgi:hypothetical protein
MSILASFTQLLPQFPLSNATSSAAMRDALGASAADWKAQLAEATAAGDTAKADALGKKLVTAGTLLAAMEPPPLSDATKRAIEAAQSYKPMTAEEIAAQEAEDLKESRKVEAQGVFMRNGKIEAVVYRDGVCYIYGEGPPGFHEFCENQQEVGEEGAIARIKKLKELWGDEVQLIDYTGKDKRPTFGDFYDFQFEFPEMPVAKAMTFLFPSDDGDDEDAAARRAAEEDYAVRRSVDELAAMASISTR